MLIPQTEYDEKKATYDSMTAGFDSNRSKLDNEVRALREDVLSDESKWHQLQIQLRVLQAQVLTIQRPSSCFC